MSKVEFGSLFEFIRNGMNVKQDKSGNGLPISRIETIWNSRIDPERVGYAGLEVDDCDGWLLSPGDILFSHINSVEHIGKCAVYEGVPDRLVHGMNLLCLRCKPDSLLPAYAKHLIRSEGFKARLSNYINKAVNQASVSIGNLKGIEVTIPSLPEQRRIAAILDKADALRTKRGEALAHLDRLAQSIFVEMFGDPVANPKGWPLRSFDEVCPTRLGKMLDQKQQTGKHSRKYLRNANVQWFRIDLNDLLEMDFDEAARETFELRDGDLLICEGGEPGRAAIWRNQISECYYQKALHRGRPDPSLAHSEYLMWLLWSLAQRGGLSDHVTSATIAHLTGEKLKAMQVPMPPLPLQSQFVERLKAHGQLRLIAEQAQAGQDSLFASLQYRAFLGEL